MLRRPPTTLTLTAEDVAAYEDRRYAAQTQVHSRSASHPPLPQQSQPTAMDTSSSSLTPSPPPTTTAADDEDMQDADAEVGDTSDPFITAPRRAARDQHRARAQSPSQARAAFIQQARATRSQHPATASTSTSATTPTTRTQRVIGVSGATATQQTASTRSGGAGGTAARPTTSRQGSSEPTGTSAPPAGRMMTRSREERVGVAPTAGPGASAASRRR
ncbi:hypothetical protein GGS23DRAFT_464908 [Durotheca rogersii]|uniref:uncharacterized protein n=1 Tax=Durotheca rogersii TaxID=419775 RepID=UPI00221F9A7E|nr:uncharacterized protein GGS23DRAFT_464908 [Durotheca rogersii]KAI5864823.1 hypothetical protein GGS23DRAFT_464908 [Durotheca rogersii]